MPAHVGEGVLDGGGVGGVGGPSDVAAGVGSGDGDLMQARSQLRQDGGEGAGTPGEVLFLTVHSHGHTALGQGVPAVVGDLGRDGAALHGEGDLGSGGVRLVLVGEGQLVQVESAAGVFALQTQAGEGHGAGGNGGGEPLPAREVQLAQALGAGIEDSGEGVAGLVPIDPEGEIAVGVRQGVGAGEVGGDRGVGDGKTLAAIGYRGRFAAEAELGLVGGEEGGGLKVRDEVMGGWGVDVNGHGDGMASSRHFDFPGSGILSGGKDPILVDGANGGVSGPGEAGVGGGEAHAAIGGGGVEVHLFSRGHREGGDVFARSLVGDIDRVRGVVDLDLGAAADLAQTGADGITPGLGGGGEDPGGADRLLGRGPSYLTRQVGHGIPPGVHRRGLALRRGPGEQSDAGRGDVEGAGGTRGGEVGDQEYGVGYRTLLAFRGFVDHTIGDVVGIGGDHGGGAAAV